MASQTQRNAHDFLSKRFLDQEQFTKDDFREAAGWTRRNSTFRTYMTKQFKPFFETAGPGLLRVRESFRPYLDWKKFQSYVTQVRTVAADYTPTVYDNVLIYEFYMPLAHEGALRITLDSLFFEDTIVLKLRRSDPEELKEHFPGAVNAVGEIDYDMVLNFIAEKFQGYSIYHVDGRFRGADLSTQAEVAEIQKAGLRYLVDETTAITRFIFPCREDEPAKVRFLFEELFIRSITHSVPGEDQIWMVESGMRNRVHIWQPSGEGPYDEDPELPL